MPPQQPNETRASASLNRRAEYVGVMPVVVAELKLRNVQRHVFAADLVEAADDPALEDRPEALNRVRVDRADNVLLRAVIDGAVLVAVFRQIIVGVALIGSDQANLVRNNLADKFLCRVFANAIQNAGHNIALAANRTDDRGLSASAANDATTSAVLIDALAADVGFIDLDDTAQLDLRLDQGGPDFVAREAFHTSLVHHSHHARGP